MTDRIRLGMIAFILVVLSGMILSTTAHQEPCHRLHRCPSDTSSYICGDKGRCDQCPDNQSCLAGKPRPASSASPTPVQSAPSPSTTTTPAAVTVHFTPGGDCTDAIAHALSDAKRSILVQTYSFTSAPSAKACLGAHTRGVRVQVILDKSQRTEQYSSRGWRADHD